MVGWKRIQFGVQVDVWGVDPNLAIARVHHFYIRGDLRHGHRQRGASVNNRVFAEEDDLAGNGSCCHVVAQIANLRYER
jgi:hypothetical protein